CVKQGDDHVLPLVTTDYLARLGALPSTRTRSTRAGNASDLLPLATSALRDPTGIHLWPAEMLPDGRVEVSATADGASRQAAFSSTYYYVFLKNNDRWYLDEATVVSRGGYTEPSRALPDSREEAQNVPNPLGVHLQLDVDPEGILSGDAGVMASLISQLQLALAPYAADDAYCQLTSITIATTAPNGEQVSAKIWELFQQKESELITEPGVLNSIFPMVYLVAGSTAAVPGTVTIDLYFPVTCRPPVLATP
ncbi:MAG TPA: hypothetical protein VFQ54_01955, partial [Thermomicrobiales bacterium]|nr:hypothetical protein [Thermomicrobiales bacterium]